MAKPAKNAVLLNAGYRNDSCTFTAGSLVGYGQYRPRPSRCYADGEHAWYGNTVLNNSGALDMDVTTGYGPEIFAMPAPVHGRYQVYINYYGGRSETELTTAQLTLITDEGSVNEKQETFIVPMRNAGELTLVKSFDW
ncbi:DUF2135 family protein, function uncharacterised [Escherichia coli]|uniref:DUF2135 family protein, function uncharacterized n=1 Tax=Escherichia coli TaxID=562 RepID=A0A376L8X2_ECOLX|nr:DUF2135 family protein, function uncharacterised [Escherichia coli]